MCRLLIVKSEKPFLVEPYLADFAAMCRESPEYQGHGWGLALRSEGRWRMHKSLTPLWEDDLETFGKGNFLAVHARSAFRNEGIVLRNNMPFSDGRRLFLFNGELRGVRIRAEGDTGARKIFNVIRRFDEVRPGAGFLAAVPYILSRARYVRALNVLMIDGEQIFIASHFSEMPDYFTLYELKGAGTAFCSQPLSGQWRPLPNHTLKAV